MIYNLTKKDQAKIYLENTLTVSIAGAITSDALFFLKQ